MGLFSDVFSEIGDAIRDAYQEDREAVIDAIGEMKQGAREVSSSWKAESKKSWKEIRRSFQKKGR